MTLDHSLEQGGIDLSRAQRKPVMKPTCGPDDGSDAGPWITRPATEIDGDHPYTRDLDLTAPATRKE